MMQLATDHATMTAMLDDRHFGLLTLIVLMWLAWGYVGMRAQRAGRPAVALVLAVIGTVVMLAVSPWLGLGAVQWIIATMLGVAFERRSR